MRYPKKKKKVHYDVGGQPFCNCKFSNVDTSTMKTYVTCEECRKRLRKYKREGIKI